MVTEDTNRPDIDRPTAELCCQAKGIGPVQRSIFDIQVQINIPAVQLQRIFLNKPLEPRAVIPRTVVVEACFIVLPTGVLKRIW